MTVKTLEFKRRGATNSRSPRLRRLLFETLEPRMLLSAAAPSGPTLSITGTPDVKGKVFLNPFGAFAGETVNWGSLSPNGAALSSGLTGVSHDSFSVNGTYRITAMPGGLIRYGDAVSIAIHARGASGSQVAGTASATWRYSVSASEGVGPLISGNLSGKWGEEKTKDAVLATVVGEPFDLSIASVGETTAGGGMFDFGVINSWLLEIQVEIKRASPMRLSTIAWYGAGQVQMTKLGNAPYMKTPFTSRGSRSIPYGRTSPVWRDGNLDGTPEATDPTAFVHKARPKLHVGINTPFLVGTQLSVKAWTSDLGGYMEFNGSTTTGWSTQTTMDLSTTQTVGDEVSLRDLDLKWAYSIDGGAIYRQFETSSQEVFVTYAQPLKSSENVPTARRIHYAVTHAGRKSTIMDISQELANDAQQYYGHLPPTSPRRESPLEGARAWALLERSGLAGAPGDCGEVSWLTSDALGVIGIWSQVRYVFPRHNSWAGIWSTVTYKYEKDTHGNRLVYIDRNGKRNLYEGTVFVKDRGRDRYYMGGVWDVVPGGGRVAQWRVTPKGVLWAVSGPNDPRKPSKPHQAYANKKGIVVKYPTPILPHEQR